MQNMHCNNTPGRDRNVLHTCARALVHVCFRLVYFFFVLHKHLHIYSYTLTCKSSDWSDWTPCKYSELQLLLDKPPAASSTLNKYFLLVNNIPRCLKLHRNSAGVQSVSVCLLGGPWNSYSTFSCIYVCRTITGLRQWRFCLTTIGGNTAAEKCAHRWATWEISA